MSSLGGVAALPLCGSRCVRACVLHLHLLGHLGGARAQLPGVSDASSLGGWCVRLRHACRSWEGVWVVARTLTVRGCLSCVRCPEEGGGISVHFGWTDHALALWLPCRRRVDEAREPLAAQSQALLALLQGPAAELLALVERVHALGALQAAARAAAQQLVDAQVRPSQRTFPRPVPASSAPARAHRACLTLAAEPGHTGGARRPRLHSVSIRRVARR